MLYYEVKTETKLCGLKESYCQAMKEAVRALIVRDS